MGVYTGPDTGREPWEQLKGQGSAQVEVGRVSWGLQHLHL